jgi:restriction system protein
MHEDGAERSTAELRDAVAGQFGISEAERQEMIPSGRARLLDNRIGWALTHLSQAGALVNIEAQLPLLSTVRGHRRQNAEPAQIAQQPAKTQQRRVGTGN